MTSMTRLATLLLLSLGCSARAGGNTGFVGSADGGEGVDAGAGGGSDAGGVVPDGMRCAAVCARLQGAPGCNIDAYTSCVSGCESLRNAPAACQAASSAVLACASTATPNCASTVLPFQGCDAALSAYAMCLATAPRDAGTTTAVDVVAPGVDVVASDPCASATDCVACTERSSCGWCAGSCRVGTGSGPVSGSCGGDRWAWTTSMCSAPVTDSGITNPVISGACQTCAIGACSAEVPACLGDMACVQCLSGALTPSCRANPRVAALVACACNTCESACAAACVGL